MEKKFELDLRMTEKGVECNAESLKEMLPEKLKPYNYVVTVNNYDDAKKDRTKLNNLHKVLQDKRKQFESSIFDEWNKKKAILMEIEKMIAAASDNLGNGIKDIDEQEKVKKMEEVKSNYEIVAKAMPIEIPFEKFYIRKEYDKKAMTVAKIMEDMQKKIDRAITDWNMLEIYLPTDEADVEQVKKVFAETLDVGMAKAKADDLKAIRERIEKRKMQEQQEQKSQEEVVYPQEHQQPQQQGSTQTQTQVKKQRIKFEVIAERPFFDAMNELIKQYRPKVTVFEKEEL